MDLESVKKAAENFFRGEFAKMAIDRDNTEDLITGILKFIDNPVDDLSIVVNGDKLTPGQIEAVKKLILMFRNNLADQLHGNLTDNHVGFLH